MRSDFLDPSVAPTQYLAAPHYGRGTIPCRDNFRSSVCSQMATWQREPGTRARAVNLHLTTTTAPPRRGTAQGRASHRNTHHPSPASAVRCAGHAQYARVQMGAVAMWGGAGAQLQWRCALPRPPAHKVAPTSNGTWQLEIGARFLQNRLILCQ